MESSKKQEAMGSVDYEPEELDYMLTTVDNPWNPHTDFEQWYQWDCAEGYYTLSVMARLAESLIHNLEDEDESLAAMRLVIDEMLDANQDGLYVKIFEKDPTPFVNKKPLESTDMEEKK